MKVYINGSICIILVVTAVITIGLVGQQDFESELAQEQTYIQMVCSKAWPDYKKLSPSCD